MWLSDILRSPIIVNIHLMNVVHCTEVLYRSCTCFGILDMEIGKLMIKGRQARKKLMDYGDKGQH